MQQSQQAQQQQQLQPDGAQMAQATEALRIANGQLLEGQHAQQLQAARITGLTDQNAQLQLTLAEAEAEVQRLRQNLADAQTEVDRLQSVASLATAQMDASWNSQEKKLKALQNQLAQHEKWSAQDQKLWKQYQMEHHNWQAERAKRHQASSAAGSRPEKAKEQGWMRFCHSCGIKAYGSGTCFAVECSESI